MNYTRRSADGAAAWTGGQYPAPPLFERGSNRGAIRAPFAFSTDRVTGRPAEADRDENGSCVSAQRLLRGGRLEIRGIVFDMDGTLVDTNWAHVEAWRRAFADHGYDVPRVRIVPEIGKGGDQLLPALLGRDTDEREGDAIRDTQAERFRHFASLVQFELFPGVVELLEALRARDIPVALATSSEREFLELIERRAACDLQALADVVVTKSDAEHSKPAPDLVVAAVQRLGLDPSQCLMVGDTTHDGEACRKAGVPFAALLCGGASREELERAGARHIWRHPAGMLDALDRLLGETVFPQRHAALESGGHDGARA